MSLVLYVILAFYLINIALLIYGFFRIQNFYTTDLAPKTSFTIIVPFRNEADNLPNLLLSFSALDYPNDLFEVILVDDSSAEKISFSGFKFQVSVIDSVRISNSPKKDAITTAMRNVKTDWVITTDADCMVPKNWLKTFDHYIQQNKVAMLAGAVTYNGDTSFLHSFQQLDLTSLQGATIGSFGLGKAFMCNGANLAYTKALFDELKGFEGNDKIASGDDVFLLQKAVDLVPDQVHYLKAKEAIVATRPTKDWKSLFHQRVRWAAKTSSYQSVYGKYLGVTIFLGNLTFVTGFLLSIFGILWLPNFVIFALLKFSFDFMLLNSTNDFLTNTRIKSLLLSSLWYPFFSTSVALYSLFGSYEWKNRRFVK